jgi:hypothetical protein
MISRAFVEDRIVRGHSFQIGADAAFWTRKAKNGPNVFRSGFFGRRNVEARHVFHPTRQYVARSLATARGTPNTPSVAEEARVELFTIAAIVHLPDRYGRKIG